MAEYYECDLYLLRSGKVDEVNFYKKVYLSQQEITKVKTIIDNLVKDKTLVDGSIAQTEPNFTDDYETVVDDIEWFVGVKHIEDNYLKVENVE